MYVVGHTVTDVEGVPKMEFDIVGTTGNIYKTTIGKVPFCNCPDGRKGNQCKHICYGTSAPITHPQSLSIPPIAPIFMTIPNKMAGEVLVNVLKAPAHLQYQLALLSSVSCPNNPARLATHRTHRNTGTPRHPRTLLPHPRRTTPSRRQPGQAQAHRRRLSDLLHGIRAREGRNRLVPRSMRE